MTIKQQIKMLEGLEDAILEVGAWGRDDIDNIFAEDIKKFIIEDNYSAGKISNDWKYVIITFMNMTVLTFFYNGDENRYTSISIE